MSNCPKVGLYFSRICITLTTQKKLVVHAPMLHIIFTMLPIVHVRVGIKGMDTTVRNCFRSHHHQYSKNPCLCPMIHAPHHYQRSSCACVDVT